MAEREVLIAYGKGQISAAIANDRTATRYEEYESNVDLCLGNERARAFRVALDSDPALNLPLQVLTASQQDRMLWSNDMIEKNFGILPKK